MSKRKILKEIHKREKRIREANAKIAVISIHKGDIWRQKVAFLMSDIRRYRKEIKEYESLLPDSTKDVQKD